VTDLVKSKIHFAMSGELLPIKKDLSPEEVNKAGQEFFKHMQQK
jgi:hypothetical protein